MYAENWHTLIKAVSIRRPAATKVSEGFDIYPGCPMPAAQKHGGGRQAKNRTVLDRSHAAYAALEHQIRNMHYRFRELNVERVVLISKNGKPSCAIVDVAGRNATFCLNMDAFHRTSRVCFYISLNNIEVRCTCKCATTEGRKSAGARGPILCSKFRSLPTPLDISLRDLLFPDAKYNDALRRNFCGFAYTAPVTPAMTPGSVTLRPVATRNSAPMTQQGSPRAFDFKDDEDTLPDVLDTSLTSDMPEQQLIFDDKQHAQQLERELALLAKLEKPVTTTTTRERNTKTIGRKRAVNESF